MKSSANPTHPRAWRVLGDEHLQDCKVFDVHRVMMESPETGAAHPFYRIESAEWVNVVAMTADQQLVMVRQYRQGARALTLEIPGGLVDPGETPIEAAGRELLEESGYRAGRIESLGSINPNPALFANRVHIFVALDCELFAPIDNGETEQTSVELLALRDLGATIRAGGIDHALVVAALYSFELWRGETERGEIA